MSGWHSEAWKLAMTLQLAASQLPAGHEDRNLVERLVRVLELGSATDLDASSEAPAAELSAPLDDPAPRR